MKRPLTLRLAALTALALVTAPAHAQKPALVLTPSAGTFLPAADLVGEESSLNGGFEAATLRHQVGPTLGLRASRRLGSRLAIEAEALLGFSDIELASEAAPEATLTRNAHVFVLAIETRLDVYRVPFTPFSAHLLGGFGLVARGGEFFDEGTDTLEDFEGATDFAGLIGAGFVYGLDPIVALRVDVRDVISSYEQTLGEVELDSKIQHDLWMSLGLEFRL